MIIHLQYTHFARLGWIRNTISSGKSWLSFDTTNKRLNIWPFSIWIGTKIMKTSHIPNTIPAVKLLKIVQDIIHDQGENTLIRIGPEKKGTSAAAAFFGLLVGIPFFIVFWWVVLIFVGVVLR